MKKLIGIGLLVVLVGATVALSAANKNAFDHSQEITVISREAGSGTRGAFTELFGVEQKDQTGNKVDYTTVEAIITNSTSVALMTVAGNKYAIGYVSLGSLNDSVKTAKIDGAEATTANIKNGQYKIARPFNIATGESVSELTQDFIDFVMSADGQRVVGDSGYIAISDKTGYRSKMPAGRIVVAGSSSATPVTEKLKEAYIAINPGATIEIQLSDSTTGINSVINGIADIGMASRALKDSELANLDPQVIAMDGIAVIVNNENPVHELTSAQVKDIFTGEITLWSEVLGR